MRNPPRIAIPAILGPDFNSDGQADPADIAEVLRDPSNNQTKLWTAFTWDDTRQGHDYWSDRANGREEISTDDIKYLRAALEFLSAKRQTSAQRIAALEEENKSLRETLAKIAALAGEPK